MDAPSSDPLPWRPTAAVKRSKPPAAVPCPLRFEDAFQSRERSPFEDHGLTHLQKRPRLSPKSPDPVIKRMRSISKSGMGAGPPGPTNPTTPGVVRTGRRSLGFQPAEYVAGKIKIDRLSSFGPTTASLFYMSEKNSS